MPCSSHQLAFHWDISNRSEVNHRNVLEIISLGARNASVRLCIWEDETGWEELTSSSPFRWTSPFRWALAVPHVTSLFVTDHQSFFWRPSLYSSPAFPTPPHTSSIFSWFCSRNPPMNLVPVRRVKFSYRIPWTSNYRQPVAMTLNSGHTPFGLFLAFNRTSYVLKHSPMSSYLIPESYTASHGAG